MYIIRQMISCIGSRKYGNRLKKCHSNGFLNLGRSKPWKLLISYPSLPISAARVDERSKVRVSLFRPILAPLLCTCAVSPPESFGLPSFVQRLLTFLLRLVIHGTPRAGVNNPDHKLNLSSFCEMINPGSYISINYKRHWKRNYH
jgi:hypothetical protein